MFFSSKAMRLLKAQAALKRPRSPRTCCFTCKEPMKMISERIVYAVRYRVYKCPVCATFIKRVYYLATQVEGATKIFRNFRLVAELDPVKHDGVLHA